VRGKIASPRLLIFGDATVDIIVRVDTLPRQGTDAVVESLSIEPGGSAANCAAVAAKLGTRVEFMGIIGQDHFSELIRTDLSQHGVGIHHLRQAVGPCAMVVIIIDHTGERTFLSYRGVSERNPFGPIPLSFLQQSDHVHIDGYSFQTPLSRKTSEELIERAHEIGASTSIDPSFYFASKGVQEFQHLAKGLDFLFPNREEALIMTHQESAEEAAKYLRDLGTKMIVIKMGAAGCLVASEHGEYRVPTLRLDQPIDTTGAGDGFAGGFLAAVLNGCNPIEAAHVGNAVAYHVIGSVGGHAGAPAIDDLKDLAKSQGNHVLLSALRKMDINTEEF
jgi:sugar/nucleoside kinase (ribokinase family)